MPEKRIVLEKGQSVAISSGKTTGMFQVTLDEIVGSGQNRRCYFTITGNPVKMERELDTGGERVYLKNNVYGSAVMHRSIGRVPKIDMTYQFPLEYTVQKITSN